ncbi:MAG: phycobiliprotein lyase [Pseudanabaenaceae cyanobacterium]
MNIVEFFQLREGTWISQRTSHHLIIRKSESGKSEIQVNNLSLQDDAVTSLCALHQCDPNHAICAAVVSWQGTMEWDNAPDQQTGSTVLVAISETEDMQAGKLLRQQGYAEKTPIAGRYYLSEDGVLSLITEYGMIYSEEKLWFPRPNICMRAGLTTGVSNIASFCTEIRKLDK